MCKHLLGISIVFHAGDGNVVIKTAQKTYLNLKFKIGWKIAWLGFKIMQKDGWETILTEWSS